MRLTLEIEKQRCLSVASSVMQITEGEVLQFTGLPFFAPGMFRRVEAVAHRLEHEYGCKSRILPSRCPVARRVTCDEADGGERELKRFIDAHSHRVAYDAVDAPTVLVDYARELRAIESNWPKIRFHALREHAGLVFHDTGA